MGETSGQIKQHICEQRSELGENVTELEHKVKSTLDWRTQVNARPFAMVGLALGGGLVLSLVTGRRSRSSVSSFFQERRHRLAERSTAQASRASNSATEFEKRRVSDSWDKIKAALLGLVITRAHQFLAESIPGFREEYSKADAHKRTTGNTASDIAEQASRSRPDGPSSEWSTHS